MTGLPVRLVTWQERLSAAFATRLLTVTELWRRTLIERGQPADRVDVVMNLPDEELFAPRAPQVRAQPDPLTLVYHGTITHRYGIDVLLDALARVRARAPGAADPPRPRRVPAGGGGADRRARARRCGRAEHRARADRRPARHCRARRHRHRAEPARRLHRRHPADEADGVCRARDSGHRDPAPARWRPISTEEMVSFVEPEDPAGLAAAIIALADDPARREALAHPCAVVQHRASLAGRGGSATSRSSRAWCARATVEPGPACRSARRGATLVGGIPQSAQPAHPNDALETTPA